MVYKNIQSLASGETKDIIIHIGPILYIPRERETHAHKTLLGYIIQHVGTYTTLKFKHDEIKPSTIQRKHSPFNHPYTETPTASHCLQPSTRLSSVYQKPALFFACLCFLLRKLHGFEL